MSEIVDLQSAGLKPWILRTINAHWPRHRPLFLNADKLIKVAQRKTRSSNFGEDWNPQALHVLVDSINNEAQLSPVGFFIIEKRLTGSLVTRLRAQRWFDQYPQILEQKVAPVCLITGLQRTGTTYLQRLMSVDSDSRSLMSWESLDPVPHNKRNETHVRIRNTRLSEKAVSWMAPSFFAIHPIDYKRPEEDVLLLDSVFMSTAPEAIMHVPAYAQWLESQDQIRAYQWEKKMLQLLQWQRPAKRWILKSPHHLEFMDSFIHVFPDTRIIWMHRDPVECLPSFLSMIYHGRAIFSDIRNIESVRDHWMQKSLRMLEHGMLARKRIPPNSMLDLKFERLLEEPVELFKRIYDYLGYKFSADLENEVRDEITEHARHRFGAHNYDLKDFGLSKPNVHTLYRSYYDSMGNMMKND